MDENQYQKDRHQLLQDWILATLQLAEDARDFPQSRTYINECIINNLKEISALNSSIARERALENKSR